MSNCHWCHKWRVANPSTGNCGICSRPVCTPPPKYRAINPHGRACECRCPDDGIYCFRHFDQHSQNNHGRFPDQCFPDVSAEAAGSAYEASAGAIAAGTTQALSDDELENINFFVNVVRPGNSALRTVLTGMGAVPGVSPDAEFFGTGLESTGAHDKSAVMFSRVFLNEGAIERVLVMAAYSLAQSLPLLPDGTGWPGTVLSPLRLAQTPSLFAWAAGQEPSPSIPALRAWLPADTPFEVVNNLDRIFRYASIPTDSELLAEWFVLGKIPVHA